MAQYQDGTVTVTNGSATVTGLSTLWLANVTVGDLFYRSGDSVGYEINTIVSDVSLTLTTVYGGVTGSGAGYSIARDFTPNYNFPYITTGDRNTALVLKRFAMDMDAFLANPIFVGDVTMSSTKGVVFSTASATTGITGSRSFDDYEEGTWVPAFSSQGTPPTSIGYSLQNAKYTKIGRLVHVVFDVRINALTLGAASGAIVLTGLPFASAVQSAYVGGVGGFGGWNVARSPSSMGADSGTSEARIFYDAGGGTAQITVTDLTSSTTLQGSFTYLTS